MTTNLTLSLSATAELLEPSTLHHQSHSLTLHYAPTHTPVAPVPDDPDDADDRTQMRRPLTVTAHDF
jgi:hypothetical protein